MLHLPDTLQLTILDHSSLFTKFLHKDFYYRTFNSKLATLTAFEMYLNKTIITNQQLDFDTNVFRLHDRLIVFNNHPLKHAIKGNHLNIVKWLLKNNYELTDCCTKNAMEYAALYGHIEIVKYLHENTHLSGVEGCTTFAMNMAASNGHIEIVKYLHENRTEGCTTYAMDNAARNGHIDIVKWLHENRTEGCTKIAIKYAARNGHTRIVKWLKEKYPNKF